MASVTLDGMTVIESELASVASNGRAVVEQQLAPVTLNARAIVEAERASLHERNGCWGNGISINYTEQKGRVKTLT